LAAGASVGNRPPCAMAKCPNSGKFGCSGRRSQRLDRGTTVLDNTQIVSFGLWIGTPLLWLWVGSQVQGATQSLGTAFAAAFAGAVATVIALAWVLAKLSDVYRENRRSRGRNDTGHVVLEAVLVVSAGLTVAAFLVWFFLPRGRTRFPWTSPFSRGAPRGWGRAARCGASRLGQSRAGRPSSAGGRAARPPVAQISASSNSLAA
jgi:hypothetical protein